MARKKTHIAADLDTTRAWMRVTATADWKLMLEDLCFYVFFNPPRAKDQTEIVTQHGNQELLRFILGRSSPAGQRAILDRLTEEVLTDGD